MLDRESMIEASVRIFAANALLAAGYPQDRWELIEAWPSGTTTLDRILIGAGFNFDDGGRQGEMGSDLKRRLYTLEYWVFGLTDTDSRNVANVLKFALEDGEAGTIPLLDVGQTPPVEIDRLLVERVVAAHQQFQEPEPWQQHVWTTTTVLEDWYFPDRAGMSVPVS